MAPKSKSSVEPMKQKSLMSWFGKNPNATPNSKAQSTKPKPKLTPDASSSQPSSQEPRTPASKSMDLAALNSSAMASSTSSRGRSTPPTSDPIDIDMLSSGEEDAHPVQKTTHRKRKVVLVDSDEEEEPSTKRKSKSNPASSSPVTKSTKKPRLSNPFSSDDEDEDAEVKTSFTKRLTNFRKSPAKKARKSRSSASDDDDFIVPSDSDVDAKSIKSSTSRSSASSRRSAVSSDDSSGEEDEPKFKSKSTKKKAPAIKKGPSTTEGASTNGGFSFLTAAEKREQEKKNDKKAAEDPYAFLADVRDKEGRRPGDPNYDPRTLMVPKEAWKEFTPFERQFWEIKQNHYDTILFFQKGKFLELYEDDARIGHQEFDLKLTSRVKMSMVGVPEMSFNFWAAKFLGKGYKVGRVDQAETALGAEMRMAADKSRGKVSADKGKDKIVRRELNKVYTNGTLVDAELLTDEQAGHCVCIYEEENKENADNNKFGVCVLDCSTSQFDMSAFEDDVCRTKLETLMRQLRPKELLFVKGNLSAPTTRLLKSILPAACLWTGLRSVEGFDYDETLKELKTLYPPEDTNDMEDDEDEGPLPRSVPETIRDLVTSQPAIKALGSMIWYLRQLNIDKDILSMRNFNIYDPMKKGQGLTLDGQTLAHIEVLLNNEGTEEGSLLKLLGRCTTPFGKRLFRIWLCMPLRQISDINARLDAVQDLIDHPTFEAEFTELAKGLPDLERIVSRIHAKNCRVRDFIKVLAAFKKLSRGLGELADQSESFKSTTILGLLRSAPDLLPNIKHVESMYVKPSSEKDTDELVPREGKDEAYDAIMAEIAELEEDLEKDLKTFEKKLGCKLTYWHSAQGNKEIYLVETSAGQKGIPDDWTKSSSTKAKSRWVVRSLQGNVRRLKEARENRNTAIKAFKFRLFAEFDTDRSVWLRVIKVFAELDCLFSLAKSSVAIGEPACRPEFVEGDSAWIDFDELRHPTLCLSTTLKSFIPNDVKLGGDVGKIALLTGPNMAGKSTVMRMTATGVIMAQLGMLVPAARARLCPVDAIITRMGAYDNMFSNASTFKVELDECCKILRDATPKSLVILDELGRGTSTYDGMAIAGAVLHQLATHTLPLSFFATHYGSLTDDFVYHPNIRNMHMSTIVDDEKRDLVFLFKLIEGAATSSFGTHVANLAGVPLPVVERADVVSKNFAQQFKERLQIRQDKTGNSRLPIEAQADFAYLYKVATGQLPLPTEAVRRREVLAGLRLTVQHYLKK
ncbi:DNA mismatch repair protein msh6 [Hypsizygus marmoreus]|uniref:DNA mismatch repair protein n=1 Tax=Hypsizygus marmoreus TaxID=39966 RepID=A0A369KDD1_HYPMA|nr:DNA mismatch repair protein msh6 [Hypsizygus marmoreus]